MKDTLKSRTPFSECIRSGFKIYPVYREDKDSWFIRVDFKGKLLKTGDKVVVKGKTLKGKVLAEAIEKV